MSFKSSLKNNIRLNVEEFKSYFNIAEDLEPQNEIEQSIRSGVSFKGSQLLVLIFAIFIASLGLNTDSIAVIIGAMLISPLMGPIIGMGLAIGIEDYDLLKRGLKNIAAAVIGSLITSCVYFLISPQYEGADQLLARTSPSIYDVFVALFGGAAGILSIACRNKGQVLPGVAIATSLMPPLCTAGYGLATLQSKFFFGALYLFFTNMIFILFATWIGVKLFKFKKVVYQNGQRAKRIQKVVYSIVFLTVGISIYLTALMFQDSIFKEKAIKFVDTEMNFPNTQVLSHKEYVEKGKRYLDVTLIGEALPKDSLQLAMVKKLDSVGLGGTILNIRQGFSMKLNEVAGVQNKDKFYELMQNEIASRQLVIDSLSDIVRNHRLFSEESVKIAPEVKVIFPAVKDLAMSQMTVTSTENEKIDTLRMIFINAPKGLSLAERKKLVEYVEVRLNKRNIHLALNPPGFPWPSDKNN